MTVISNSQSQNSIRVYLLPFFSFSEKKRTGFQLESGEKEAGEIS
jgi:hypothetical protein